MHLQTITELNANRKLHGRTTFQGLPISIENRKGSVRRGCHSPTNCWATRMSVPYGYIRGTRGVDGDAVDCFLGRNSSAKFAYVVHTRKAPDFKTYDEDKVLLGFDSAAEAKKIFLRNYSDARFFGGMDSIPMAEFKAKVLQTKSKPQKLVRSKLEEAMEHERLVAMGEPNTYGGGMAHMDTTPSFHPPSLRKPQRVPADNPGEKDDRFLDVTKRKSKRTKKFAREITRRNSPSAQLPGGPTQVQHHTGVWLPRVTDQ